MTAIVTRAPVSRCECASACRSTLVNVSPLMMKKSSGGSSDSALRGPPADPSTGDSNEYLTRRPRSVPSPTRAVIVSGR
jgi:hypothetical protein